MLVNKAHMHFLGVRIWPFWSNEKAKQSLPMYQPAGPRWIMEPTYVGQTEKIDYVLKFPDQTKMTRQWPWFLK